MISNVSVQGLKSSIKASKYPMYAHIDECAPTITTTVKRLGRAPRGSGHDQFLTGINVQFDLTFSIKAWTEMQRYHFVDFVSSQSTMHCITKFDIPKQCNKYVTDLTKQHLEVLVKEYNRQPTPEKYLKILYNIPAGFELTARITTNYRQLKTIYYQRKSHKLPEWREFCAWCETLPQFKTLVLGDEEE